MDIAYDRYSMIIDGRRVFIRSGAMHYFRLPSQELWKDRLFKLKAAGYNAVDLYFCWGYHSPEQGIYDFTGIRDVRKLLQITQELGLYVIARPGPYINAEYTGGGFPGWLLAKKHLPLRNRREGAFEWSEEYMGYVREWWEQIIPIINEAPNILMVQIENEYATLEVEPDYMRAMYDMTREMGVTEPLFHNDLYVAGLYEDIVDIYSFDNYSVTQFETDWREMPEIFQVLDNVENSLRPFCQNRPLMVAELQAGWYGTWKGYKYEKITELLGREHIGISTKSLLGQGLTVFNHYKAIGGTNWNYTGSTETYTSYDFGAPISEAGLNTERLFEAKAINYFLMSFDFTETERRDEFPLALSQRKCLYAIRSPKRHPDTYWLFLRNLTYEPEMLTIGERYPVVIRPFEVLILPYRVLLQCGYELEFSTGELLYQNESTLVLKADRPLTVCLRAPMSMPPFVVEQRSARVEFLEDAQDVFMFECPELSASEFHQLKAGDLNIILLGQHLSDTFWLEEDGSMVAGAEMRLMEGSYGIAQGGRKLLRISKDGSKVTADEVQGMQPEVIIPLLKYWEIYNDAPELSHHPELMAQFSPVANGMPDFDANGLYEGSAWYRLPLGDIKSNKVAIDARHIWAAFLNGQYIGQGHQWVIIYGMDSPPQTELSIPETAWRLDGKNELLIFVSGLGHPKGFHDDAQTPQGLLSVTVDSIDCTADTQILGSVYSRRKSGIIPDEELTKFTNAPIVRMKTSFTLPEQDHLEVSWGLKLQDMDFERINIYLNGFLIGRYWRDCKRQEVFYLPSGILQAGQGAENTLELLLMNFEPFIEKSRLEMHPQQVVLHPYGVFLKALHRMRSLID